MVVLVGGFLVYAATRPDTFRVQRTATIKAPPEKIFPHINDFQRWSAWSPYEKKDPAHEANAERRAQRQGRRVRVGRQQGDRPGTHGDRGDRVPPSQVTLKLDFTRPFEAHNIVDFTLEPRGDSTQVTWAIHGPSPFMSKVMGIVFDMDKMIGKDFEAGLAELKTVSEQ